MKYVFSMTLALALLASAPALAEDSIDVMTQNQYLGADLTPIITAPDGPSFNLAVIAALQEIAANDFPARAQQLAELIADREPELVGLQEVFEFSCDDLPDPGIGGCAAFAGALNDHLGLTMDALEADYDVAAVVENLNFTTPVFLNADFDPDILVTIIDRDVILAHGDVTTEKLVGSYTNGGLCGLPIRNPFFGDIGPEFLESTISEDGCNYTILAPAILPDGSILPIKRGFVGVDAMVDGKTYRFVNTHLEVMEPDAGNPDSAIFQSAQSFELLATLGHIPSNGSGDLIVGDINSSPDDEVGFPPYAQFVAAGYTDPWDLRPGNEPGFSCCQEADLSNQQSILGERIDVIFSFEVPNSVKKARVLGTKIPDKTPPPGIGLWPSDHGSVAAELRY
jgi:hypothetical protein